MTFEKKDNVELSSSQRGREFALVTKNSVHYLINQKGDIIAEYEFDDSLDAAWGF